MQKNDQMSFFNRDQDELLPNPFIQNSYQSEQNTSLDGMIPKETKLSNHLDDERSEFKPQLSPEDQSLQEQLVSLGFSMENENLRSVQIINSVHSQMEVVESIIFRNCTSSVLQNNFDFDPSESQFHNNPSNHNSDMDEDQESYGESSNKVFSLSYSGGQEQFVVDTSDWQLINQHEKQIYLWYRQQANKIKTTITQSLATKEGECYTCIICNAVFSNGRKLGGHMSRKHPGNSVDNNRHRASQETRAIEKERRLYFRNLKQSSTKTKPIAKQPKRRVKKSKTIGTNKLP